MFGTLFFSTAEDRPDTHGSRVIAIVHSRWWGCGSRVAERTLALGSLGVETVRTPCAISWKLRLAEHTW